MQGFNKGGFNMGGMQQLMKQAQKMQEDMARIRAEIDEMEFSGTASSLVEIVLHGNKKMKKVSIQKQAVDIDDLEMLEDLIIAAYNEALTKIETTEKEKLPQLPAGL